MVSCETVYNERYPSLGLAMALTLKTRYMWCSMLYVASGICLSVPCGLNTFMILVYWL